MVFSRTLHVVGEALVCCWEGADGVPGRKM
jgi:hypothetical protein